MDRGGTKRKSGVEMASPMARLNESDLNVPEDSFRLGGVRILEGDKDWNAVGDMILLERNN